VNSLTPTQLEQARAALLDRDSDSLVQLIFKLNLSLPLGSVSGGPLERAVQLGWVTDQGPPRLTLLGSLVADPIREYQFWLDRDRRIHGELDYDLLAPENYRGKSVLEPGSGFGCNLLSLSRRVPGHFVGVEPVAVYRQLTPVFAEREGLPIPLVVDGASEQLPFEDGTFDTVLCYSAHQYMDVRVAIAEMARVLKPGGQVQIIGATIAAFLAGAARQLKERPRASLALSSALTVVNTLSYQGLGRRAFVPASSFATAAPIYPTLGAMRRWFAQSGLEVRSDLMRRLGSETCFVADKP